MRWPLVASAAAVLLRGDCSAATCGECVASGGCGWCAVQGVCRAGTASGPLRSSCLWEFGRCSAAFAPPCAARRACGACTADTACGWCEATQSCLPGGGVGPSGAVCSAGLEPLWVHARGLRPACAAPPAPAETDDIVASANARVAQAEANIAAREAQAREPCPTTPAPTTTTTTTTTTTLAPTEPPVKTTHYYFVTQPPVLAPASYPLPPLVRSGGNVSLGNASASNGTSTDQNATALFHARYSAAEQAVASPSAVGQIFRFLR